MTPMMFLDGPLKHVVILDDFHSYRKHTYALIIKCKGEEYKLYCDVICKHEPPKELPISAYHIVIVETNGKTVFRKNLAKYYKQITLIRPGQQILIIEIDKT